MWDDIFIVLKTEIPLSVSHEPRSHKGKDTDLTTQKFKMPL